MVYGDGVGKGASGRSGRGRGVEAGREESGELPEVGAGDNWVVDLCVQEERFWQIAGGKTHSAPDPRLRHSVISRPLHWAVDLFRVVVVQTWYGQVSSAVNSDNEDDFN